MPGIVLVIRRGAWCALAFCLLIAASACGGRHLKLMFGQRSNATAERRVCSPVGAGNAAGLRPFRCVEHAGDFPAEVGNTGRTVAVDIPDCAVGQVMSIVIMDADRANPQAYVTCGQDTAGHDLNGGIPIGTTSSQPTAPAPAPSAQPEQPTTTGHDLRGGDGL